MALSKWLKWGLAGALVTLGVVPALAQTTDWKSDAKQQQARDSQGNLTVTNAQSLSGKDLKNYASAAVTEIRAMRAGVAQQLAEARQAKDAIKVLCLDDVLNQLGAAERSAVERSKDVQSGPDCGGAGGTGSAAATPCSTAQAGQRGAAEHAFTMTMLVRERAKQLQGDAARCIGSSDTTLTESKVKELIDAKNIANRDPWEKDWPVPNNPFVDVPKCTSCVR